MLPDVTRKLVHTAPTWCCGVRSGKIVGAVCPGSLVTSGKIVGALCLGSLATLSYGRWCSVYWISRTHQARQVVLSWISINNGNTGGALCLGSL